MVFQRPSHGGLPLCSSNNKPCQETDSPADKTWELHHITYVDGFQGCTRREWDNWECSVLWRLKAGGGGIASLPFTTHLEKIQANFLDVCSKRVKGNGHKLQGGKFQVEISGGKNHHEGSQTPQHRVCETSIVRDIQSSPGQALGKVQSNPSDTAVRKGWHRDLQRLPLIWKNLLLSEDITES